jgi:hypothetical protein
LPPNFESYVTNFASHKALELIAVAKMLRQAGARR